MEENSQIGSGIVSQKNDLSVGSGLIDITNQTEKNLLRGTNLQGLAEAGAKQNFLRKSAERFGIG